MREAKVSGSQQIMILASKPRGGLGQDPQMQEKVSLGACRAAMQNAFNTKCTRSIHAEHYHSLKWIRGSQSAQCGRARNPAGKKCVAIVRRCHIISAVPEMVTLAVELDIGNFHGL